MKNILCYGDSNTYGYNPDNGNQYDHDLLWTSILNKKLGDQYKVFNEGLNGRTTIYDRDFEPSRNGLKALYPILDKYSDIDVIIFMLGTNDCNVELHLDGKDIAFGMRTLISKARDYYQGKKVPRIIVVAPACIYDNYHDSVFAYQLDDYSISKSKQLASLYKELCEELACDFVDASKLEVSKKDAEHLLIESHNKLANMLYELLRDY